MSENAVATPSDPLARTLRILSELPPEVLQHFRYEPGGAHDDETLPEVIRNVLFDTHQSLKVPLDAWADMLAQVAQLPENAQQDAASASAREQEPTQQTADETTQAAQPAEPAAVGDGDDDDDDDPRDENTWLQTCDKLDAMLNEGGWPCLDDTFQFVRDWLKRTATFAKEDPDTLRVLNVVKKLPAKNRAELAAALESGTLTYCIGPVKGLQAQADAIEAGQKAIRELYGLSYKVDGAYFSLRSIEDSKDSEQREMGMNAATEIIEAMGVTMRDELGTCERSLGGLSRIISAYERQTEK